MHARLCLARPSTILGARVPCRWAFWLVLVLGCLPTIASAQPYRTDPVDTRAKLSNYIIRRVVSGEVDYAAEKQTVHDYFTKYFFPAMTSTEPTDLANLADARDELIRKYLAATSNKDLQHDLTALTFDKMKAIIDGDPAQPPYDPRVRYNAVLILGLLDDPYASQAGPAKPYVRATAALYAIVKSAAANGADSPYSPALVLGALLGLERHVHLHRSNPTLPQNAIDAITADVLTIATRVQPLPGTDADVHAWIRLQAARVLAQFGNVGNNNQVYNAILQLTANLPSLDDRCEAAAMLGMLSFDGATIDGTATAKQMLQLASDVGDAELARALEYENRRLIGSMGVVSRSRGSGRSSSTGSADTQDKYPRRPLLARLTNLRDGLAAAKPLVPQDAQATFDAALAAIGPVIQAAANRDTVELQVAERVRTMAGELKRVLATPVEPAAEITEQSP